MTWANRSRTWRNPTSTPTTTECTTAGCNRSPNIWRSLTLAFTGNITSCTLTPNPVTVPAINVPNGGFQTFDFSVSDANGNAPGPGTSISFSATAGTLQGQTSFILPDIVGGPFTGSITLAGSAPPPSGGKPGSITMTVGSSDVVP